VEDKDRGEDLSNSREELNRVPVFRETQVSSFRDESDMTKKVPIRERTSRPDSSNIRYKESLAAFILSLEGSEKRSDKAIRTRSRRSEMIENNSINFSEGGRGKDRSLSRGRG